jgi:hypothetical protein
VEAVGAAAEAAATQQIDVAGGEAQRKSAARARFERESQSTAPLCRIVAEQP